MSLEYVPAEGKVAVQILDDIDGNEAEDRLSTSAVPGADDSYDEALIALCVGAGPKVTNCKRGDTVFVYPWARNGLKISDDVRIVDSYCIAARVK